MKPFMGFGALGNLPKPSEAIKRAEDPAKRIEVLTLRKPYKRFWSRSTRTIQTGIQFYGMPFRSYMKSVKVLKTSRPPKVSKFTDLSNALH